MIFNFRIIFYIDCHKIYSAGENINTFWGKKLRKIKLVITSLIMNFSSYRYCKISHNINNMLDLG